MQIRLAAKGSPLLNEEFLREVIQRHFFPLLFPDFDQILRTGYKDGVAFNMSGQRLQAFHYVGHSQGMFFLIHLGKSGKPAGIGFLSKYLHDLPEEQRGLAISTFGKVIKRGWEWVGIQPTHPAQLSGIVEISALAEILTTNKLDFLRDASSLRKYYSYRKAIQEAIEPLLRQFGEAPTSRERPERDLCPLEREIERVLGDMLADFPELSPLLGRQRRGEPVTGILPEANAPLIGRLEEGVDVMTGTLGGRGAGSGLEAIPGHLPGERIEQSSEPTEPGQTHEGRSRRPGLLVGFEDDPNRSELGWLSENTIWINRAHPVYLKVDAIGTSGYHIMVTAAWVLSQYLEADSSPQDFMNRFLSVWGGRQ